LTFDDLKKFGAWWRCSIVCVKTATSSGGQDYSGGGHRFSLLVLAVEKFLHINQTADVDDEIDGRERLSESGRSRRVGASWLAAIDRFAQQ
jgi:hypothetical protein